MHALRRVPATILPTMVGATHLGRAIMSMWPTIHPTPVSAPTNRPSTKSPSHQEAAPNTNRTRTAILIPDTDPHTNQIATLRTTLAMMMRNHHIMITQPIMMTMRIHPTQSPRTMNPITRTSMKMIPTPPQSPLMMGPTTNTWTTSYQALLEQGRAIIKNTPKTNPLLKQGRAIRLQNTRTHQHQAQHSGLPHNHLHSTFTTKTNTQITTSASAIKWNKRSNQWIPNALPHLCQMT